MPLELVLPFIIAFALAIGVPALFHLTKLLGPKASTALKNEVYESGVSNPLGDTKTRFGIKFYLVAIMFIIFDVEILFILAWAVNAKVLGLFGLIEMFIFVTLLVAGLIYVYMKGALDWN